MSDALLTLDGFGVAFGAQTVLSSVTLSLPRVGMTSLVGPAGSGKSTLLRTLSGLNEAQPQLVTWGSATFDGAALRGEKPQPGATRSGVGVVMQHAKF